MTFMKKKLLAPLGLIAVLGAISLFNCCSNEAEGAPTRGYKVVAELPHDPVNFTQGLMIADGFLYEGTGKTGESRLMRIDMKTGKMLKQAKLDNALFGEGVVVHKGLIYQLTWHKQRCIVFDQKTMIRKKKFKYQGQGWGITTDGTDFFMSNGSDEISIRDPETFEIKKTIKIVDGEESIYDLNELEYIAGEIWANIWQQDRIARIDPATGKVNSWVDCSGLKDKLGNTATAGVLNGIAIDPVTKNIWITGKNWDKLFHIEVD